LRRITFGIRKRLLEIRQRNELATRGDLQKKKECIVRENVFNSIYLTMLFDTSEDIVVNGKNGEDYEAFQDQCIEHTRFAATIQEQGTAPH